MVIVLKDVEAVGGKRSGEMKTADLLQLKEGGENSLELKCIKR